MQFKTILRSLGLMLAMFSLTMLPPALIAIGYHDSSPWPYLIAFAFTATVGSSFYLSLRTHHQEFHTRDGFLLVALFWFVLCLFAAIPLMLAQQPHDSLTDALFESVSGFTTTGATVVQHLNGLPHAMLYYRQQLQFFGGMGIVVLAVAILPMLGIGGMQLYKAETPGPIKDSKLTPRITQTAKTLWFIYLGLTVLCAFSYYLAGMPAFNAIGEAFSTISTGGFSMHDNSFTYYHSQIINSLAGVFMILGATNFSLHFLAWKHRQLNYYWQDEEFRSYIYMLVLIIFIALLSLYHIATKPSWHFVTEAIFNVISIVSTTGFATGPIHSWPMGLAVMLAAAGMIGGCAASTSGGVKVIRMMLLNKQTLREIKRLVHPQAIVALKYAKQLLPESIVQAVWGFIAAYIALFVVLLLLLMMFGLDLTTAFAAMATTLSNVGAGLGGLGIDYHALNIPCKWILMLAMLAGRLEIFTLLVLFTPHFWRG